MSEDIDKQWDSKPDLPLCRECVGNGCNTCGKYENYKPKPAQPEVKVGQVWRHKVSGNRYRVDVVERIEVVARHVGAEREDGIGFATGLATRRDLATWHDSHTLVSEAPEPVDPDIDALCRADGPESVCETPVVDPPEPEAHPSHDFSDPYAINWAGSQVCKHCGCLPRGKRASDWCNTSYVVRDQRLLAAWREDNDRRVQMRQEQKDWGARKYGKPSEPFPEPPPRTAFDANPALGGPLSLSRRWR